MNASEINLNRQPAPAEVAAFGRAQLPSGRWAALYAAPLAAITSQIMQIDGSNDPYARSDRWPWNQDPDRLPGHIGKAALLAVSDKDPLAVRLATDWLQSVLPPLGATISWSEIDKAIENKRPQVDAALDLLAWHLAKDVPPLVLDPLLAGCERFGVLASNPSPPWPTRHNITALRRTILEAANGLRSRVVTYLSEKSYGTLSPPAQLVDLSALLVEGAAVLASARHLQKGIRPEQVLGDLAKQLSDRAAPLQEWIGRFGVAECEVPDDVYGTIVEVLAHELASLSSESRNDYLDRLGQLLVSRGSKRMFLYSFFFHEPTTWIDSLVGDLRNRIANLRSQAAEPPHPPDVSTATDYEGTQLGTAPEPPPTVSQPQGEVEGAAAAVEPTAAPTPQSTASEALPVAPPPPPVLEVIEPAEYVTIPFAACLRTAAGPGAADAEWAVSAPLLFSPDPAGPQVVVIPEPIPDHLWFVGDIHADILSLENAWQFIRSEAERDGVAPSVVFLGDFIDRGHYDHETLVRLFRLIRENMGRIVVVAGNHDEALRIEQKTGRFASDVEPAEYKDELNARLSDASAGDPDAADRVAVGRAAVRFFARCPRALFLPDGTLVSHAGFPHRDLHPTLRSVANLRTAACLQDFAWLRASRTARRKLPNRHTRGCEFGADDFADFCQLMAELGISVKRLIRGHDHVAKRYDLPARYAAYPVLTINTLGRRLADEFNPDPNPWACVARHRLDQLPIVYRLPIDSAEVSQAFPGSSGAETSR